MLSVSVSAILFSKSIPVCVAGIIENSVSVLVLHPQKIRAVHRQYNKR